MDTYAKRYNDIMLGISVKDKNKQELKTDKITFYSAQEDWAKSQNKKAWDTMFFIVFDIALSWCKKKASGVNIPNLVEKAKDAAILSMDLIKRNKGPNPQLDALITWVSYQVTKVLYDQKLQMIEHEYSYDLMTDKDYHSINSDKGDYNE